MLLEEKVLCNSKSVFMVSDPTLKFIGSQLGYSITRAFYNVHIHVTMIRDTLLCIDPGSFDVGSLTLNIKPTSKFLGTRSGYKFTSGL